MAVQTAPPPGPVIEMRTTKVFKEILQAWVGGLKGILLEGGTYSSKTYSALQFLTVVSGESKRKIDIDIISESVPHLKGGCIKDFFNIVDEIPEKSPYYNQTDHIYRNPFDKGVITFLSADNEKALGMRRDILFINEGDTLSWATAKELISRTNLFVIIDWNPRSEFWAHKYYKGDPKWAYSHSTYLDALDVIPPGKREDIEDLGRKDPNYYNIYQMGLMGRIEGQVHPYFEQIDLLPKGDYFYGLDFGFGSYSPLELVGGDPTVLVKNVIVGDNLYSQQLIYERKAMTNDDIAREMQLLHIPPTAPIYPDPNEPKSAEEIRQKGFNVLETEKGAGSVKYGIKKVNSYYQFWTKDSLECIDDQRNYKYIKRKDPNTGAEYWSDDTTHQWSHGMDSLVAGTLIRTKRGDISIEDVNTKDYVLTRLGWKKVLDSFISSPAKEVLTLTLSNQSLVTGTADHLIWVRGKGYVPLNTCRYGDIIDVCERQLPIMVKITTAIQKQRTGRTGSIIKNLVSVLRQKLTAYFIDKFGLMFMERYRQVVRFTTRMTTQVTTHLGIWSACQKVGITSIIQPLILSGELNGLGLTLESNKLKQMRGTALLKEKSGIENWESYRGKVENHINNFAPTVGRNTLQEKSLAQQGSAPTNAKLLIGEKSARIILKQFARGVIRYFKRTNIAQSNAALVYVLNVSGPQKDKQPVYDLTIQDIPEFYANGILVHNSRRYACASYSPVLNVRAHPAVDY